MANDDKIVTGISSSPSTEAPTAPVGNLSPVNYQDFATHLATQYGVDPGIVNRMIGQESSWNPSAISPKGAIGLAQLMPETAAQLGVDPHSPIESLEGGIKYFSQLYKKYGDYGKALAAYNAGPGAVDAGGELPDETKAYVARIMSDIPKGPVGNVTPYTLPTTPTTQPPVTAAQPPGQTPPAAEPAGPLERAASSFTESFGLPADIRDWPSAFKALADKGIPLDQIPSTPAGMAAKGMFAGANIIGNVGKGVITSSMAASQEGLNMMRQPGISNKLGGFERYIIGGIPQVGPVLVRWADQLANGDVAGSIGTLAGLGVQGLMTMPDTAAAKLQGAAQYLVARPRVQETILASEAQHMLESAEASARSQGHSLYPESDAVFPGSTLHAIAGRSIANNMAGSPNVPPLINNMISDDMLNRALTMKDLQGYYTELGAYTSKGNLPGDIYKTATDIRENIGTMLERQYVSENKGPQWEDAQAYWANLARKFWDKDSPLAQSMRESDATAILRPLIGDQAERATQYLKDFTSNGADPNVVNAAEKFYRGMDRMQFRGLWRAAGPLMIGTYLARAEGVPYSASMGLLSTVIAGKMGLGYLETRPSMIKILSNEPPTVPGQPWIPRQSPFTPFRPGSSPFPPGNIPTP